MSCQNCPVVSQLQTLKPHPKTLVSHLVSHHPTTSVSGCERQLTCMKCGCDIPCSTRTNVKIFGMILEIQTASLISPSPPLLPVKILKWFKGSIHEMLGLSVLGYRRNMPVHHGSFNLLQEADTVPMQIKEAYFKPKYNDSQFQVIIN